MKFGVQDVIASNSLDQSLNSSIQLKRKWNTNTGKQTARDFGVFYKENLRNDREHVPSPRRTGFYKMNFLVGRPIKSLIAIDGSDRA